MTVHIPNLTISEGSVIVHKDNRHILGEDKTLRQILDVITMFDWKFEYGGFKVENNTLTVFSKEEDKGFRGTMWLKFKDGEELNRWEMYRLSNPNFLKALNPQEGAIVRIKGIGDFTLAKVTHGDYSISLDVQ